MLIYIIRVLIYYFSYNQYNSNVLTPCIQFNHHQETIKTCSDKKSLDEDLNFVSDCVCECCCDCF